MRRLSFNMTTTDNTIRPRSGQVVLLCFTALSCLAAFTNTTKDHIPKHLCSNNEKAAPPCLEIRLSRCVLLPSGGQAATTGTNRYWTVCCADSGAHGNGATPASFPAPCRLRRNFPAPAHPTRPEPRTMPSREELPHHETKDPFRASPRRARR